MTPEERKSYNEKYYKENKTKILSDLSEKVKCQFCDKSVSRANLMKHYQTKTCFKMSSIKKKHNEPETN